MGKALLTLALMLVTVPVVGTVVGLVIGRKGENLVIPAILVSWGVIVYCIWFR